MLPNDIFILGSGSSIRYSGALNKGLWKFLSDKFVIGINYSYKYVETTCNLGVDELLYNDEVQHKVISQLPLWIGKECPELKKRESNSIFFKPANEYDRNLKKGVYRSTLSGIFALSLAIKLHILMAKYCQMPTNSGDFRTFLIGFDYGPLVQNGQIVYDNFRSETFPEGRPITHFYQEDFAHRGTGKINWYCQTTLDYETRKRKQYAEVEFAPYKDEKLVKIINVGGTSNIPTFPQIQYDELFSSKRASVHSQTALRNELREVLEWIKHENQI